MAIAKTLRRERTNATTRGTTTFNVSGNYKMPYGKTKYRVGGISQGGDPPEGGNYAGSNPSTYIYNSSGSSYRVTNYSNDLGAPGSEYAVYPDPNVDSTVYSVYGGYQTKEYTTLRQKTNQTGNSTPLSYGYATTDNYANGTVYYTSNVTYKTNQTIPGNANYNPYYPGTYGSPFTVGGVTFPGGFGGSGNAVAMTPATIAYSTNGLSISFGQGARVSIENT